MVFISSHVTAIVMSSRMSKFGIRKKIQERSIKSLIVVFRVKFYDFWWKLHLNRIKWRKVTGNWKNSISHDMNMYGQTLRVFKRENDECIRNREKTNLHTIKIVVFFYFAHVVVWRVFRHKLCHCEIIWRNSWRNTRHSSTYAKSKKLQFWFYADMSFLRCKYIHRFFA